MRANLVGGEALHQRGTLAARTLLADAALDLRDGRADGHELPVGSHPLGVGTPRLLHLHEHLRSLLEHGGPHGAAHGAAGILAVLVMLQEFARGEAPRVLALGIRALQDVLPERLCDVAVGSVLALALRRLALGRVAEEEEPSLLLDDVRLLDLLLCHGFAVLPLHLATLLRPRRRLLLRLSLHERLLLRRGEV